MGWMFLFLVISAITGAFIPLQIAELAKKYPDQNLFWKQIQILGVIFLLIYSNRVFYQFAIARYIFLLMNSIRNRCYREWLLSYNIQFDKQSRMEQYSQGEIASRIMSDTESIKELVSSGALGVLIDIAFVITCLGSFISLNTFSGIFLTAIEILAIFFLFWISKKMRIIFLEVRKSRGLMGRMIANLVGGFKQIYYTQNDHYSSQKGAQVFDHFLKKILRSNIWDAGIYSLAEGLYPILLVLIVLIFPYSHITDAAIIFAIIDLIQRSIRPIKEITAKITSFQRAYAGLYRIQEFLWDLNQLPSLKNQSIQTQTQTQSQSQSQSQSQDHREFKLLDIQIKHFIYPKRSHQEGPFELKNICFKGKKGQLIGIVGLSGSGKSTLLGLLAADLIPTEGRITLYQKTGPALIFQNQFIDELIQYREQVSLIGQDAHLFSASLAYNISFSFEKNSKDLEQFWIWVKKEIPYLRDWGIELRDQLNISKLSIGQRQLLAALRSCYLKKPIVLFDEISSALDGELEQALRKVILMIQQNSLTVMVAHRLETIKAASDILVMHGGLLIDRGNHLELAQRSSIYKQFLEELSPS